MRCLDLVNMHAAALFYYFALRISSCFVGLLLSDMGILEPSQLGLGFTTRNQFGRFDMFLALS